MTPAIVDSTHCHLWTDALHVRQLARDALNKWDRGTYVRMCVSTTWTALEVACQDALANTAIGQRFKDNLDAALAAASLPPVDWSRGIWQKVTKLHNLRNGFIHRFAVLPEMFPDAGVADGAIATARTAIGDIYQRAGKPVPDWLTLDHSRGWQTVPSVSSHAFLTVGYAGVDMDDPNATRIFLVVDGEERPTTVLPPSSNTDAEVEYLRTHVKVPIDGIRVYEGKVLVKDYVVNMRGNS